MRTILSPKTLAEAIGVSESSLRRWIDSGAIQTSRTVGGHRRIPLAEAVRFIREARWPVVRPELLGISEAPSREENRNEQRLFELLESGDGPSATSLVFSMYLGGSSLPALFDGPIARAMHRVGELWEHSPRGILVEHRATAICVQILHQLRQTLPAPADGAPVALGGAPEGDPYLLPSLMAATTLADAGFRDIQYGSNTPLELLGEAAAEIRARLVWVSFSTPDATRVEPVRQLARRLEQSGTLLVIGGREAPLLRPDESANVHTCRSMAELWSYARGVLARRK